MRKEAVEVNQEEKNQIIGRQGDIPERPTECLTINRRAANGRCCRRVSRETDWIWITWGLLQRRLSKTQLIDGGERDEPLF